MHDEHKFEAIEVDMCDDLTRGTLLRVRVPGGWLYVRDIVYTENLMSPPATALAFVPDAPKATRGCRVRRIRRRPPGCVPDSQVS